jgi:carbamoyl-phosphate synthase small subunit
LNTAWLILKDGSVFEGISLGAAGAQVGEVVFNTSMTGYQEILTDPSYRQQLVTLTYPHIGNVGCNPEDIESGDTKVHAAGLIIRSLPPVYSNFRASQSLDAYLKRHQVVAITEIDTRALTQHIREKGAQNGVIVSDATTLESAKTKAQAILANTPDMVGLDLAQVVSTTKPYEWNEGEWQLGTGYAQANAKIQPQSFNVVAYDFGVKRNILRMLAARGCRLTVVPARTPAAEVLAMNPDGVFLSNGPGDPAPCEYAIEAIAQLLKTQLPIFGICLGHQLLGLAAGAKTVKMKFGHHGGNHPVADLTSDRVVITSQNHGFAIDETHLPNHIRVTHRSLFDQTVQGIELTNAPAFSFQGHPEASPGPQDIAYLFDRFVNLMVEQGANSVNPIQAMV